MDDKSIYDDNGVLREKDEEQINKDPVPESEITDEKAAASEGEKENGQQPGTEWAGVADGFTEMSESGAVEEITDEKAAASEGEKENGQQPGTEWAGVADGFTEMSESGAVEEVRDENIGHAADASGSEACPANDVAFSGTKGKSVTKKRRSYGALCWIIVGILAFCCVMLIYGMIEYSDSYVVSGNSMTITVTAGEGADQTTEYYGYVNGSYVYTKQEQAGRGDVVILYRDGSNYLIKRIIGLAGDSIWLEDGYVWVKTSEGDKYVITEEEGAELSRIEKNREGNLAGTSEEDPFIVPEGCIYYMGDNRNNSTDSRQTGAVPENRIISKVKGFVPQWYIFVLAIRNAADLSNL